MIAGSEAVLFKKLFFECNCKWQHYYSLFFEIEVPVDSDNSSWPFPGATHCPYTVLAKPFL